MRHEHSAFWAKVVLVLGIIWGTLWLFAGEYHPAGLNFSCAFWAGMYADRGEK